MTESDPAPINSDPSPTVPPQDSGGLSRKPNSPLAKEGPYGLWSLKLQTCSPFGMFAVEVFAGKILFEEQKKEPVALHILQGSRPKVPGNAQTIGLTADEWNFLNICWMQNPKKRHTMEEVVSRWGSPLEAMTA